MIRNRKLFYLGLALMGMGALSRHGAAVDSALGWEGSLFAALPAYRYWVVVAALCIVGSLFALRRRSKGSESGEEPLNPEAPFVKESFGQITEKIVAMADQMRPNIPLIVDYTIFQAIAAGASDIHFDPAREGFAVRFRIDGMMSDIATIPARLTGLITNRLKVLSNLVVYQGFLPQDGRLDKKAREEEQRSSSSAGGSDFRIAFMPTLHGERIVIRILGRTDVGLDFAELGMDEAQQQKMTELIAQPQGMIVLTGPTGSGKTTTIYAALRAVQAQTQSVRAISTLEDPIEYEIAGINQSQVDEKKDFTFDKGLRAILRQDPDVIMVGEIRDTETARIAIQSGMTGHLIITTVHANSSAATFSRLIEMGVAPFALNSAATAVISQRLVRRVCAVCRVGHPVTVEEIDQLQIEANPGDFQVYEGGGCETCGQTGLHGRHALFEILEVSEPIRQLISTGANADAIYGKAKELGMLSLYESAIDAVKRGVTTPDEVARVVVRDRG